MRLLILAVGRLKDGPERDLVGRYVERIQAIGRPLGFTGIEIAEVAESRATRPADRKAEEAAGLRQKLGEASFVALDENGTSQDSEAFAAALASRRDGGCRQLAFVIGGADGLDAALIARADQRIGFGRMTIPHQIVRVLVAEQLYRAMTILCGHPYHRP